MHDFYCKDASEMYYPVLANRVMYFKENEEGVRSMSRVMEDIKLEVAILTAIEVYKDMHVDDERIIHNIMEKFELTRTMAEAYLIKKSA